MGIRRRLTILYYSYKVAKKAKLATGKVYCTHKTTVSNQTTLGDNVNFNGAKIGGIVSIGNNFHSAEDLVIMANWHNFNGDELPYDDTHIEKKIVIEDHVWIGYRVTIVGNLTIGEGAIIQAGSVVTSDIPPLSIAGGNPAKVFKTRDPIKFSQLKKEHKWHYWS